MMQSRGGEAPRRRRGGMASLKMAPQSWKMAASASQVAVGVERRREARARVRTTRRRALHQLKDLARDGNVALLVQGGPIVTEATAWPVCSLQADWPLSCPFNDLSPRS